MNMLSYMVRLTFLVTALLLPVFSNSASAQSSGKAVAQSFVAKINEHILFPLIMLMMGIAMIFFLYGAFQYVLGADNESARATGKQHLLWGVIGFLVMVSAMAILAVAANTFGLGSELQNATPRR